MKVTHVSLRPTEAAQTHNVPALTPELLAATAARYSRNNEGLTAILDKIDPNHPDKSVDAIFRMVDYGHQSIADMVPIAMFMDTLSIWLVYYMWTICPTAGGQESSTRYLKLSADGLPAAAELGIPAHLQNDWAGANTAGFAAYQSALQLWGEIAEQHPEMMGIPPALLSDPAEAAVKKVARLRRNYAFDRARYFLPVGATTNCMMIMSARGWVTLCQHLLSHPLPEPRALGEQIKKQLALSAPRMLKHAGYTEAHCQINAADFHKLVDQANQPRGPITAEHEMPSKPRLQTLLPPELDPRPTPSQIGADAQFAADLAMHHNRYAPTGKSLQRTSVRFSWPAVSFAEIRDLNRHRTGTKHSPQIPQGFYFALDQLPPGNNGYRARLLAIAQTGVQATNQALRLLREADPTYIYWTLLGTAYPFEHTTTADKFLYEAELRTGLGAHYRYARHLRDVLALWYTEFPATKGLVLEGSAEPE
jgi:thymidylate synthase ThyX